VNALPAGLHELDPDDPSLPATLRETLIKAITARGMRRVSGSASFPHICWARLASHPPEPSSTG